MLEDDFRNVLYQDYTALMMKILTETFVRFAGGEWSAPSFIEMVYKPNKGEETAEEIKNRVLSMLA